ncbi:MAG: hypothetical protein JNG88_06520 [Phycisphaerales bacterium]|nr:hypothetical protein [Phycisphaerales bacterium]
MPRQIFLLALIVAFISNVCALADEPNAEQARMIDEGMVEALDAALPKQRTPDHLSWLARSARVKASKAPLDARDAAWESAVGRYRAWIAGIDNQSNLNPQQRAVAQALARVELADAHVSYWAAPLLDDFEITGGRRGDIPKLTRILQAAVVEHRAAQAGVAELLERYERSEDEFLASGLQHGLSRLRLDARYQFGWTSLYLAQTLTDPKQRDERSAALKVADDAFAWLIDRAAQSTTQQRCRLGRAIVLREAGRAGDSEQQLRDLLSTATDLTLRAHSRYELIRALAAQDKFGEARESISQLVNTDTARLLPEERGVTYYVELARLWDASIDLVEAAALRRRAAQSNAREPLLQQAVAKREQGLAKLDKLRERGGDWPGVAQVYALSGVDIRSEPRQLATGELPYVARALREARRYREALVVLDELVHRAGVDAAMLGDAEFEAALCKYEAGEISEAAADFAKFAGSRSAHPRAAQALTNAFRLYARIAAESQAPADYQNLAGVLMLLVQSFPKHPDRAEAQWWLPVALQKCGKLSEAATQFANVPQDHPRYEEARYQRLVSERMLLEAQREQTTGGEFVSRARKLAEQFDRYSRESLDRPAASPDTEKLVRETSAEACVIAAELLMLQGVGDDRAAAAMLSRFERDYPNSALLSRALGLRIRANIGIGKFDDVIASVTRFLGVASPDRVAPLLAIVTDGILNELDRLDGESQSDAARVLAADAIAVFEQIAAWCRDNSAEVSATRTATRGLAEVYVLAGRAADAVPLARSLVAADARNGDYQRLLALALEGALTAQSPPKDIEAARDAWSRLLADESLRQRAPDRYWEARLHFLRTLLRLDRGLEVVKAIEQDRVWSPDLGGRRWRARFEELMQQAVGKTSTAQPTESRGR